LSSEAFILQRINRGSKIQELFITGSASRIVSISQHRGKKM
jgi:hypothetical protein